MMALNRISTLRALAFIIAFTGFTFCGAAEDLPPHKPGDKSGPQANLADFQKFIAPIFEKTCLDCHGPKKSKGNFRVDELDPNLITSADIHRWVEVYDVLSHSEMPPDDEPDYHLSDEDRARIVDWLGAEMNKASQARRNEGGHSSFRRMANYEYNYALQDLLGLNLQFSKPLPPETVSKDGFKNSSELLQMSAMQFETYREIALDALKKATVTGERPEVITYQIPMQEAMDKARDLKQKPINKNDPDYANKKNRTHIFNKETGEGFSYEWTYYVDESYGIWNLKPDKVVTDAPAVSKVVAVLPPSQQIKLDLGNSVPDEGIMRVRIRAGATGYQTNHYASLRLNFGFQSNNEGKMSARVSQRDIPVTASFADPQFITFNIALSEIPRNPFRRTHKVGDSPNATEFLEIENIPNAGIRGEGDPIEVQFDYIEIDAGLHESWPPKSHAGIFFDSSKKNDEKDYSREVLKRFMTRAWRRPIEEAEVDLYSGLFLKYRTEFPDFEEAMIEVLATVLASPDFLYLIQEDFSENATTTKAPTNFALASRLSFFLWSSIPDSELLELAGQGKLGNPEVLESQIDRMLADSRSQRFARNFVEQWLGLDAIENLIVDQTKFKVYDDAFKETILNEPIAFFEEVLKANRSIMNFLQSDYLVINEDLACHYGIPDVYGQEFRKVAVGPGAHRGGILTSAAVMTINSTGVDSNPLKRGVWLLERILHDPPPPPPPNVPKVDLTDPRILSMTPRERMADHRNQAACRSCHAKIDPWGLALENYDAIGRYRTTVKDQPIDATAVLYNNQQLDGDTGLKDYLLSKRQDQFAGAMVHKLSSYALGRPITFSDREEIDKMTQALRGRGDGLKDLVSIVIQSKLFGGKIMKAVKNE